MMVAKYSAILIPPLIITLWTIQNTLKEHDTRLDFLDIGYQWGKKVNEARRQIQDGITANLLDDVLQIHSRIEQNISGNATKLTRNVKIEEMMGCPQDGEKLVGRLHVDQSAITSMVDVEKAFSLSYGGWVERGGSWRPRHCQARRKVAIILPYRNRYEQLKIFLRHIHPILKRQLLDYRIFTIEQVGETAFNRAILLNIGFKESLKFDDYQCLVFHDVDLLPEDDRNLYGCPISPRHMCPSVDKFFYRLPYKELFGGVEAFRKEHFQNVNGFSNKYWGWGGEDDDMYYRLKSKGLQLTRPSMAIGRYKMLKQHHHTDGGKEKDRHNLIKDAVKRMDRDGLDSLKYKLVKTVSHLLYTHLQVEVDPKAV